MLVGVIETSDLAVAVGWQSLAETAYASELTLSEAVDADIDQLKVELVAEWESIRERLGDH